MTESGGYAEKGGSQIPDVILAPAEHSGKNSA
jgi:hypothetical protein